jgi:Tol biopolymer transport system component
MIVYKNGVSAACLLVLLAFIGGCKKDDDKEKEIQKAFAFLVKKPDNSVKLYYIADDQTSFGEVVPDDLGSGANNPTWSPDGRTIYYIKSFNQNGVNGIYSTKPNGEDQGAIYTDNDSQQRQFYQLTSSSDNENLVFSLQIPRTGRQVIELYRMCPCGNRVNRLTNFETSQPNLISTEAYAGSFASDNKTLVFCQSNPTLSGRKDVKIYKMDISTGKDTLIKTFKAIDVMGAVPSISPDGKKILLSIDGVINVMDANGANMKNVANLKGFHPSWDANSTDFYFSTFGVSDIQQGIYRSNIYVTDIQMMSKSPSLGQYGGFAVNR